MHTDKTSTNVSFQFLKNSSEFLNLILDNMTTCVLLLNSKMELQAFNPILKTIFSNKKDEEIMHVLCGEAIGCAYQIEEQKNCGKTSQCNKCGLRLAAMRSYMNNEVIYKRNIIRPYYTSDFKKVYKHLHFSTRLFIFNREKYIIILVDDVTPYAKHDENFN